MLRTQEQCFTGHLCRFSPFKIAEKQWKGDRLREKMRSSEKFSLPFFGDYGRIFFTRGRGVVANMRPCQGRDRGFEPRRSRQSKETFKRGSFLFSYHLRKTVDMINYNEE